jgi:hypothetical protein
MKWLPDSPNFFGLTTNQENLQPDDIRRQLMEERARRARKMAPPQGDAFDLRVPPKFQFPPKASSPESESAKRAEKELALEEALRRSSLDPREARRERQNDEIEQALKAQREELARRDLNAGSPTLTVETLRRQLEELEAETALRAQPQDSGLDRFMANALARAEARRIAEQQDAAVLKMESLTKTAPVPPAQPVPPRRQIDPFAPSRRRIRLDDDE